jgi:N-acetyltransferase
VNLERFEMVGKHVRLERATPVHREALREALDCDPGNWDIQVRSAMGHHFDGYWKHMIDTPGRIAFVIRDAVSGGLIGTSSYLGVDTLNRTLEIGSTWFTPQARGTKANPETKMLMLSNAFDAGALRVQFTVDRRNDRSRGAMARLGAVEEGVIRNHLVTWTGHQRDSSLFSIIADEWPSVCAGLELRVEA